MRKILKCVRDSHDEKTHTVTGEGIYIADIHRGHTEDSL